jgi:hypothetical protein
VRTREGIFCVPDSIPCLLFAHCGSLSCRLGSALCLFFSRLSPSQPMGCFRSGGLYFVHPPGPFCTHRVPTHQVLAPSLFSTPLGRWAVFVSKACTLCIHPDPFVPFESCVRLECGRFRPQTPSQTGSQADVAASRFSTSRKLRFLVQCACGWFGGCLGICRFHSHHCICFPQILDTSL